MHTCLSLPPLPGPHSLSQVPTPLKDTHQNYIVVNTFYNAYPPFQPLSPPAQDTHTHTHQNYKSANKPYDAYLLLPPPPRSPPPPRLLPPPPFNTTTKLHTIQTMHTCKFIPPPASHPQVPATTQPPPPLPHHNYEIAHNSNYAHLPFHSPPQVPATTQPPPGYTIHAEIHIDVPVEHGLLVENLLDLAHAPFTHQGTFAKDWPVPDAVKFHANKLLSGQWDPYPIEMAFQPPCMVRRNKGLGFSGSAGRENVHGRMSKGGSCVL